MIPEKVVEEAVAAILKGDRSDCDCRISPLEGHDVNPPCNTRTRVTEQVRLTLDIATSYLTKVEDSTPKVRTQWGIFGVSSPLDSEPIIPPRFPSRELALSYIKEQFPSPQFFQARERTSTGWVV